MMNTHGRRGLVICWHLMGRLYAGQGYHAGVSCSRVSDWRGSGLCFLRVCNRLDTNSCPTSRLQPLTATEDSSVLFLPTTSSLYCCLRLIITNYGSNGEVRFGRVPVVSLRNGGNGCSACGT
jgi:hypothetical protein